MDGPRWTQYSLHHLSNVGGSKHSSKNCAFGFVWKYTLHGSRAFKVFFDSCCGANESYHMQDAMMIHINTIHNHMDYVGVLYNWIIDFIIYNLK